MEVGVRMSHVQRNDWPMMGTLARLADDAGFDSLWIADHLQGVPDPELGFLESWTIATAIGATTSTLELGVCAVEPLRHPGLLAKMATALDIVTGGRLRLLLTTAYWEPEYRAFGYDFPPPGVRVDALEEAFRVVRGLLDTGGEPFSFDGTHVCIDRAVNLPPPIRHVPVAIGGTGHRVLRLAAREADEWSCPSNRLDRYPTLREEMDALVAEHGRPIRRVVSVVFRPGQAVTDGALGEVGGSPEQMIDTVGRLAALGIQDLNGLVSDVETLEAVAEVLPMLQSVPVAGEQER